MAQKEIKIMGAVVIRKQSGKRESGKAKTTGKQRISSANYAN
jgi:hypothetical protein